MTAVPPDVGELRRLEAASDELVAEIRARRDQEQRIRARVKRSAPKEWQARNRYRDGWADAMEAVAADMDGTTVSNPTNSSPKGGGRPHE